MKQRRGLSVRAKVLATVVVLAATGMFVAQFASFVFQSRAIESRVDAAVEQEVAEFRALATEGIDPDTGEAFSSVEQLLVIALQRNVPDQAETFLTLLDGKPYRFSAGERPFEPEAEPEVLRIVAGLGRESPVLITDAQTSVGRVRVATVQVSIAGEERVGTYLIAYSVDVERRQLIENAQIYTAVAVTSLVLLTVVGWVFTGRLLRPLRLLREASDKVSESDLTQRIPLRGNDDVTEVTRNFNAMLDRLQASFATQREFIDDAGHELRTPVTILRGHLELVDPADPVETEETRVLLLDEVDRMSRLVEDLILLAKSDRPDFLRPEPVEVGRLLDDLADKARGLGAPGARDWRVDARGEGWFVADPQRLTQAVLQLVHNAVKFTDVGDVVAVGATWTPTEVRLWVRDSGAGIPEQEQGRIFDRFSRVEGGRGVEGSGLGLAIVDAIAQAHGGRVQLRSRAGAGSTFTLCIPVTPLDPAVPLDPADSPDRATEGA